MEGSQSMNIFANKVLFGLLSCTIIIKSTFASGADITIPSQEVCSEVLKYTRSQVTMSLIEYCPDVDQVVSCSRLYKKLKGTDFESSPDKIKWLISSSYRKKMKEKRAFIWKRIKKCEKDCILARGILSHCRFKPPSPRRTCPLFYSDTEDRMMELETRIDDLEGTIDELRDY